jgi:hypothetical protein
VRYLLVLVLALVIALCARAQGLPAGVIKWYDGYKDIRVGNEGPVIWAYWFGVDNWTTYVKKRVIDVNAVTAESKAKAVAWIQGKGPTIVNEPADPAIWNSPSTLAARTAMDAAIAAEVAAGTIPKPDFSAPAPDVYKTPPTGTFTVYSVANGKLSGLISGVKALPNELCDCVANSVMSGTSRFCTTSSIQSSRVTYCVKGK